MTTGWQLECQAHNTYSAVLVVTGLAVRRYLLPDSVNPFLAALLTIKTVTNPTKRMIYPKGISTEVFALTFHHIAQFLHE